MKRNSSNPINFTRTINNTEPRTGANWKGSTGQQPTAKLVTVGNYRPDHNKQYTLGYYGRSSNSGYLDANAFRARPMKHYRKQYGNTNNKQTHKTNLMNAFERPNGTLVKSYNYTTDCQNNSAPGVLTIPNFSLKEINQFNKVGKDGSPTHITYNSTNEYQTKEFYDFKKCLPVCDTASKARKRTQYQSNINVNTARPKYYQTSQSYLQSRCKTFSQSQGISKIDGNTYNNKDIVNNSVEYNSTSCFSKNSNCKKLIYKPSNGQYSNQGAVSAGSRLLRLKLNTIQTAAHNANKNNKFAPVDDTSIANALSYSGRSETPFTIKSKYQSPQFYKNFHISRKGGKGNHTTNCFNGCNGSQPITNTVRQNPSIKTSGVGARTCCGKV